MAWAKGFQYGNSNFWKLIRNPNYCGIIRISANRHTEEQFAKAVLNLY